MLEGRKKKGEDEIEIMCKGMNKLGISFWALGWINGVFTVHWTFFLNDMFSGFEVGCFCKEICNGNIILPLVVS